MLEQINLFIAKEIDSFYIELSTDITLISIAIDVVLTTS